MKCIELLWSFGFDDSGERPDVIKSMDVLREARAFRDGGNRSVAGSVALSCLAPTALIELYSSKIRMIYLKKGDIGENVSHKLLPSLIELIQESIFDSQTSYRCRKCFLGSHSEYYFLVGLSVILFYLRLILHWKKRVTTSAKEERI